MVRYLIFLSYIGLILCTQNVYAQADLPERPAAWVTDYTGTLSTVESGTLNEQLAALEQRSSNQIFIAFFNRIPDGYYLEDFSVRLYEKWRPGLPEQDNGILIVIFKEDRKVRIEVGYGLEDAVTDAQAGRIIRDIIAPAFQKSDYYGGLRAALEVLIPAVEGKYQLPREPEQEETGGISFSTIFIIIMLIIIVTRMFRGPRSAGYGTRRRGGGLFFPGPIFGGFGGGRSGGGFGGGGFSGGFGGMSGGGGASGSW